jgi:hypothetical protein
MTTVKKYLLVSTIIIACMIGLYGYREFNRKVVNLSTVKPQETTSAANLIAAYDVDEAQANKQYLGKTILVTGNIAEINNQQDTLINILLGNAENIHKVSCIMDIKELENIKKYVVGKPVAIKGICTGFLADVELNRCVIVTEK